MSVPTIKTLQADLGLDLETATKVRGVLTGELCPFDTVPSICKWARECLNMPLPSELKFAAIDELIGGYGVEYYQHGENGIRTTTRRDLSYINMGDTYNTTIVRTGPGHYVIRCIGDMIR